MGDTNERATYQRGYKAGIRCVIMALRDGALQQLMLMDSITPQAAARLVDAHLDAIFMLHRLDQDTPWRTPPE